MSGEYTMGHLKADIERFVESRDDTNSNERFDTERDQARDILGQFAAWLDKSESEKIMEELVEARKLNSDLNRRLDSALIQRDEFKRQRDEFKRQLDKFNQL
jgi:Zn-finger nucleic acid-binding protein